MFAVYQDAKFENREGGKRRSAGQVARVLGRHIHFQLTSKPLLSPNDSQGKKKSKIGLEYSRKFALWHYYTSITK